METLLTLIPPPPCPCSHLSFHALRQDLLTLITMYSLSNDEIRVRQGVVPACAKVHEFNKRWNQHLGQMLRDRLQGWDGNTSLVDNAAWVTQGNIRHWNRLYSSLIPVEKKFAKCRKYRSLLHSDSLMMLPVSEPWN